MVNEAVSDSMSDFFGFANFSLYWIKYAAACHASTRYCYNIHTGDEYSLSADTTASAKLD
jgi:hypothetical protein